MDVVDKETRSRIMASVGQKNTGAGSYWGPIGVLSGSYWSPTPAIPRACVSSETLGKGRLT